MDPRVQQMVSLLAKSKTVREAPSLDEVKRYLATCFPGAEKEAALFHRWMSKKKWRGKDGQPLQNWRTVAARFASTRLRRGQ